MKRARVEIKHGVLVDWLTDQPGAQAVLLGTATSFRDDVEQASPVGTSKHWGKFVGIHGYFKRRFHVRPFRGGYRVYNRDQFAALVEYGSRKNRAYAPFRRTLRRYNGKENPKGAETVPFVPGQTKAARP